MARYGHLATRHAERVLEEHRITSIPVDSIALANSKGIEVLPKEAAGGVSGMLIRVPGEGADEFIIGYATHIDNDGFKRFAISHELGHYFLPGHPEKVLGASGIHESRAGFVTGETHELEADHFAAGLLMPRVPFRRALVKAQPGFAAVESLSSQCETSYTATAIRYAQLAEDPVAAVVSEGHRILYCFMSEQLEEAPGIQWIRKGEPLPRGTATETFNRDPDRVLHRERVEASSSLRDWFGDGPDVEITEDIIGLGSYGRTLTILVAEPWPDDEEEAEEELADFNPTFHRSKRR